MRKVTYGVKGLIDWNAMIPVGKARLQIHFSGGAITKYGITPAEFTTTDPITQRIIEDSAYYRKGKITTLRSTGKAECAALSRKNTAEMVSAYSNATLPFETAEPQTPAKKQSVKVACIEDAVEYMREHYGLSPVKICTADKLNAAAKMHGVEFVYDMP